VLDGTLAASFREVRGRRRALSLLDGVARTSAGRSTTRRSGPTGSSRVRGMDTASTFGPDGAWTSLDRTASRAMGIA
jgi:hypothetical protein